MSQRTYLTIATVAGAILLARPDTYTSLFAGTEPDLTESPKSNPGRT